MSKKHQPIDFSVLARAKKLRLGKYETTTPAYLEDYERRLIAAGFSQEFCMAECHRQPRWYDIVRLARQTRISYRNYLPRCAAEGLPVPPEPDTIAMLLLATQLDPDGTPEAKDAIILEMIDVLEACLERYQEDEEEEPADFVPEPFEEALCKHVPVFRHRRRLMAETRECHTGEDFVVRVFGMALEKGWLTWAQCRRKAVREAFRPFLPGDAEGFSKGNLNYHMNDKLSMYKPKE